MANLKGGFGELSFTVSVTSKETGEVKEYQLSGFVNQEQLEALQAEGLVQSTTEEK